MEERKIVRRNYFFEKTCPFYMCSGDGIMLMGLPGREYEAPCLCKKETKLSVVFDTEERKIDLQGN